MYFKLLIYIAGDFAHFIDPLVILFADDFVCLVLHTLQNVYIDY